MLRNHVTLQSNSIRASVDDVGRLAY